LTRFDGLSRAFTASHVEELSALDLEVGAVFEFTKLDWRCAAAVIGDKE
jgi:hypothetical protein